MKARLIKKTNKPAPRPASNPAKKPGRPGGPAVDPRIIFASLFNKDGKDK